MHHPLRYLFLLLTGIPCVLLYFSLIIAATVRSKRLPMCPHCGRPKVRPSRRQSLIDHLMSASRMPPFRCQGCLRRFYAFSRHAHMEVHSHHI